MLDEAEITLSPVINDAEMPALQKISLYFDTAGRWKAARKDYVLSFLNVWYADENAVLRQKMSAKTVQRISPMLARIVQQGIEEGSLKTKYPNEAASMLIHVIEGVGNLFIEQLILGKLASSEAEYQVNITRYVEVVAAYTDAIERFLGAPNGALVLMDRNTIEEWAEAARIKRSADYETLSTVG